MTVDVTTALANEARRQELKLKVGGLKASKDSINALVLDLQAKLVNLDMQVAPVQQELTALEQGAGPGITADFGQKSIVTQLLEAERDAAKSAVIDLIKSDTTTTEAQAAAAWNIAAAATHSYLPMAVQDGLAMGRLYQLNLYTKHLISTPTWEDQKAWIITTDKSVIMST